MSCLSKQFRLNNQKDFNRIYKSGKKWHTSSFVAFFKAEKNLKVAFVASKKVGNAVVRSKSKRRLRGAFLSFEDKIISGNYIFVVKDGLSSRDFKGLLSDFRFAFRRMELFK